MGAYKKRIKKGWRWYYQGQYLNKRYHSRAIYLTKAECLKAERKKLEKMDEFARNPVIDLTFLDLINDRLTFIQQRKSREYYRENKRYFKKLLEAIGKETMVTTIKRKDIELVIDKEQVRLKKEKKTNTKVNSMIRCTKALFNYGIKKHEIDIKNPCKFIDQFQLDIKLKYLPPVEDIESVLASCNEQQASIVEFVYETSCRINEAVRFKYSDIEGDLITLYTRKAKNSNLTPRRIPKPACLKQTEGKGKVFQYSSLPRFLERKIAKLKQPVWSWHCLRHKRASMWANSGMSLIEIMHRLGHSNISTTQGYLQLLGFKY